MNLTKKEQARVVEILNLHSGLFGNERKECQHLIDVIEGKNIIEDSKVAMDRILNRVSIVSGIDIEIITSKTRLRDVVLARSYAVYQAYETIYVYDGEMSLIRLGKHFGVNDHATVLHGYRRIKEWLKDGDKIVMRIHDAYMNEDVTTLEKAA